MNTLKIRVWNKYSNEWVLPSKVEFAIDGQVLVRGLLPENYDIQLFTGLTDKAGKEIYESDIVTWYINGKEETGTVVFDTGHFWIENVWNDWLRGEYEVKGNIYEDRQ